MAAQRSDVSREILNQRAIFDYLRAVPDRLGGELSGEQGDISWKEGVDDLLAQSAAVAEANGVILTTRTNTRWRGVLEFPIGPHRVGRLTYKAWRHGKAPHIQVCLEYSRRGY